MKKQCMPKVNQNIACSRRSSEAFRWWGASYQRKENKARGAFSPRFFFPRQFFSRALLSERDMISFKDTTIVNQLELTLPVPSLTWVMHDVKKDKGGRTKHNFVHKWKSFLNFIYVR